MDANKFDELLTRLAHSPSRRDTLKGLVGGALATVGIGVAGDAEGKGKGKGKADGGKGGDKGKGKGKDGGKGNGGDKGNGGKGNGGVDAERCLPEGQRCGKKSGASGGPCKKCCSRYDTLAPNGRRRCTCRPDGLTCTNSAQCCNGACIGGVCGLLS